MSTKFLGIIGAFALIGACTSCRPPEPKANNLGKETPNEIIVGGQKDEHGCPVTAGYTWSITRNICLRIWEEGNKLDDLRNPNSSLAIFIIQNGENGKIELFLPDSNPAIVLEKSANYWQSENGKYRLEKRNNGDVTVYFEGKVIAGGKL